MTNVLQWIDDTLSDAETEEEYLFQLEKILKKLIRDKKKCVLGRETS